MTRTKHPDLLICKDIKPNGLIDHTHYWNQTVNGRNSGTTKRFREKSEKDSNT